jgi:hypothetical protein
VYFVVKEDFFNTSKGGKKGIKEADFGVKQICLSLHKKRKYAFEPD